MTDAVDKLKSLLAEKEKRMGACTSEISFLERQREELQYECNGIREAINAISPVKQGVLGELSNKYAGSTLTPAVLGVIETTGTSQGLLVPEIIDHLRAGGFKNDAENFYSSVYSVALRLVKQGKVAESKKEGKRSFMRNQLL